MSEEKKASQAETIEIENLDEEKVRAEEEELVNPENGEAAKAGAGEESTEDEAEKAEDKPAEAEEPQQAESERYSRLFAEFTNYKRRTEKEKADLYAYAGEKFAKDLLEVIDNFERAMEAKPEGDKFAEGMDLILTQLRAVMQKNHVEEIEALGKAFDPNFHNAVMTEASEDAESGVVTKVFQKGYTLNGKVIRPSMVAVSQ